MNQQAEEKEITAKYYKDELTIFKRPEGNLDLFARSGQRRNEVIIGGPDNDWDTYCMGYRRAADALVGNLTQNDLSTRRDYSRYWESLGYTILFLYRHYLELRIKEMFLTCNGKREEIENDHRLLTLWKSFLKQNKVFSMEYNLDSEELSEESLKDIETVGKIIAQFNEVDRKSQVFRYPINKQGKVSLEPMQFDIIRLKTMLGWTSQFLDGWSSGIYECWQAELKSRYEGKQSCIADSN